MTMTVFTLLTAIIIAFVYGWQLTLLILACIPFVIATNAASVSSVSGHAAKDQKALEEAGRVSSPILTTGFWCEITFKDNITADSIIQNKWRGEKTGWGGGMEEMFIYPQEKQNIDNTKHL